LNLTILQGKKAKIPELINLWFPGSISLEEKTVKRILVNPPHYAYLRIADGCDHLCSFCAIPGIRGSFSSLAFKDVVSETQRLAEEGVKEIDVIAQDTSSYGKEIKSSLPELLKKLVKVDEIDWIRLQYLYPASVTDELLNIIAGEEKICKYIDMPIQHISEKILKSMKRPGRKFTLNLLSKIKEKIPDAGFRTAVIVGYPGESQTEFNELYDFIADFKFNHLGAFEYSNKIMKLQQKISLNRNKEFVGKTVKVIIDEINEAGEAIGRRNIDAPEVDNIVHIQNAGERFPGDIISVIINKAEPYDLHGELK